MQNCNPERTIITNQKKAGFFGSFSWNLLKVKNLKKSLKTNKIKCPALSDEPACILTSAMQHCARPSQLRIEKASLHITGENP